MRLWTGLLVAIGLAPSALALAVFVGLGAVRSLSPVQIALAACGLVVLPIAGMVLAAGRQPWSVGAAMVLWPLALSVILPGYFPGEIRGALGVGLGILASFGGAEFTAEAARFGRDLELPESDGSAPLPEAERATHPCRSVATALASDQVALPYEGQGHSMAVPVQFGETELTMLFDTGATVTTLSQRGLARLGITVPRDAPEITLRTANGERTTRLVLVPRVWVGGLPVDGVTVGVCDECEDDKTAGLLGLNVSGQFLVTVDTARQEVVFQGRQGRQDRVVDIGPWLKVRATAKVWPDGRVEVEVTGHNGAARAVDEAEIGIHCAKDNFVARLADIAPGTEATVSTRLPAGADCDTYSVTLDHAWW
ncbi:MAG: hypothetical protein EXR71_00270 [Myxococcales bacterium]|nr:hypothetical protein [Myxococcales bacterium]